MDYNREEFWDKMEAHGGARRCLFEVVSTWLSISENLAKIWAKLTVVLEVVVVLGAVGVI